MRLFFLSLFLLLPSLSFAEDYYWNERYTEYPKSSSPSDACNVSVSQRNSPTAPYIYSFGSISRVSSTEFKCVIKRVWANNGTPSSNQTVSVTRKGTNCPSLTVFNPLTGVCDPPPQDCTDTQGTTLTHLSPNGITRPSADQPFPQAPRIPTQLTMCSDSCRYAYHNDGSTVRCGSLKNGDPLIEFCVFDYKGTGETCSGDPSQNLGNIPPVPPTDPNDPTDPANNCGKGHVWSGTTCVPVLDPTDPCVINPAGPGCSDTGNPGGGDPGGGDPGGGDPGGGDPCVANPSGPGCPGNGTDPGGGDPGDGDSDDVLDGLTCDVPLQCTGDAVQCAILNEQKRQNCSMEYTDEIQKRIAADVAGDRYKLQEQTVDLAGLFNEGITAGRWLPSSCPADQVVSLSKGSYAWSWEPQCEYAYSIGPLIVIAASIFFVGYVGRAFGSGGD